MYLIFVSIENKEKLNVKKRLLSLKIYKIKNFYELLDFELLILHYCLGKCYRFNQKRETEKCFQIICELKYYNINFIQFKFYLKNQVKCLLDFRKYSNLKLFFHFRFFH